MGVTYFSCRNMHFFLFHRRLRRTMVVSKKIRALLIQFTFLTNPHLQAQKCCWENVFLIKATSGGDRRSKNCFFLQQWQQQRNGEADKVWRQQQVASLDFKHIQQSQLKLMAFSGVV